MISGYSFLTAQSFKVFEVSDLKSVFEDGFLLPPTRDTVQLFGIRGETISGQVAIYAEKNLANVTVEIGSLKNHITDNTIPGGAVEWNFVGSIPLAKNAPNQPPEAVVRQAPARFPDYLMEERQLDIDKGVYQGVWFTLSIPENAEAGDYSGIVNIKSNQGAQSIPIHVVVYPLTLPSARHLKITEWYTTRKFKELHGIEEEYSEAWFDMLRKYADNMVSHRQNIFQVPMNSISIVKAQNGDLEFDFSRFDQIAQIFWNTGRMDYLETGELAKFETDWYGSGIVLKDFKVINKVNGEKTTMPGTEVVPFLLPAFESHLRQKGWLKKTLFHVKDEPTLVNSLSWRKMSRYIHKYAPDLIRIDAIETTNVFGDIEIAIPKLDYLGANYDIYKQGQQDGAELWLYTVGIYQGSLYPNKTIDMPVIDSRILHWINYKYDLSGYLHWGWNQWTDEPFLEVGQHLGDGWHVYPVRNGLLNSLRWEQMRNGIQDYELLWMLEDKITALKDSLGYAFSWIDPKQRGREIAGRVVMELDKHTNDPDVLYQARKEMIMEILECNTSPMIYVQTSPKENSIQKASEYLTEVYGWTDPGTHITVNGKEIPVSEQGLFMINVALELGENSVQVVAINSRGSKEIIRHFSVQ